MQTVCEPSQPQPHSSQTSEQWLSYGGSLMWDVAVPLSDMEEKAAGDRDGRWCDAVSNVSGGSYGQQTAHRWHAAVSAEQVAAGS